MSHKSEEKSTPALNERGKQRQLEKKLSGESLWQISLRKFSKDKVALAGLFFIFVLIFLAIFADLIAPYSYKEINLDAISQPPSATHIFGTDFFGRDMFSRVIYGTRISLLVGIVSQSIALILGLVLGSISGYYTGWSDTLIMRVADVIFAFPSLLLIIAIMVSLGPGLQNIFLAIGLVGWVGIARIIRSQTLSIKEQEFVMAAKSLGASDRRVIIKHIMPNAFPPLIVSFTMGMAGAIMSEATLSFLGLGAQPPTASWGGDISAGLQYLRSAWWISFWPGVALALTVLAFNLFGDGLRDALDPSLRNV